MNKIKQTLSLSFIFLLFPFPFLIAIPIAILYYFPPVAAANASLLFSSLSIILIFVGLFLSYISIIQFLPFGLQTIAIWGKTTKLIVTGPYRYVRNPMLAGAFLYLLGLSLFFESIPLFIWALTFFVGYSLLFLYYEEPKLLREFGNSYKRYQQQVSRWIPRLSPWSDSEENEALKKRL